MAKKRLVILISGNGSNMLSVIDAAVCGKINAIVEGVISSNHTAGGLIKAQNAGIKTFVCALSDFATSLERDQKIAQIVRELSADYIILAGYLGILSPFFIDEFAKKIINIHPALLPGFGGKGFYGLNVHKAVLAAGEKESGATVHFVDSGIDTGEIILSKKVPVLPGVSPEDLQKRVLEIEHGLLVEAIKRLTD